MRVILLQTVNPCRNLATEEYLLKHTDRDVFMLWRNSRSIIVGRNQNTLAEINLPYVREHDIPVVRRLTGGGAVFHDLGNVNYTFIESGSKDKFGNYEVFSRPIISALKGLGVNACLQGRNDLCIDGLKFSGNAQVAWHDRIMHHGTLLFSASVNDMTNALKVSELKIKSKGIKSVRSRVTNISEHLLKPMSVEAFCAAVTAEVTSVYPGCELRALDESENRAIDALTEEKYNTWGWNYGYNKEYSFFKETKLACGIVQVKMNIENDRIKEIRVEGDYFGRLEVSGFEEALTGTAYDPSAIGCRLEDIDVSDYFSGATQDEILDMLL